MAAAGAAAIGGSPGTATEEANTAAAGADAQTPKAPSNPVSPLLKPAAAGDASPVPSFMLSPGKGPRGSAVGPAGLALTPLSLDGGSAGGGSPGGMVERPSFAELLARSLRAETTTRAWFDEAAAYAWVKQSRMPLKMPKVMAIQCTAMCAADVALWQPVTVTEVSPGVTPVTEESPGEAEGAGGGAAGGYGSSGSGGGNGGGRGAGGGAATAAAPGRGRGEDSKLSRSESNDSPVAAAAGVAPQAMSSRQVPWLPMVLHIGLDQEGQQVSVVGAESWAALELEAGPGEKG